VRYKCVVCAAEFTSLLCRDQHLCTHVNVNMDSCHAPRDVVICSLCNENCDRQSYLPSHLQSHQLIYFCSVCSASFPSSQRLVRHLVVHRSQPSLSSTDLFWQSIAASVFQPQSDGCDVSWLDGNAAVVCEEQMNSHPSSSLEDVVQCSSLPVFPPSDTEMLASICSSPQEHGRKVMQCAEETDADCSDVNASTSSFNTPCIDRNVCFKMGFKPMSRDIFNRLRQTFGRSECEHCGKLFSAQLDLDTHVNVHTGVFLIFFSLYLTLICDDVLTQGSQTQQA